MMVSFQKEVVAINKLLVLQVFVRMFTMHNISAPNKHGVLELKENYAHVIHVFTERNQ